MKPATQLRPSWAMPALIFAGLWLVITGANAGALMIGVPVIALATWASLRIDARQRHRVSLAGAFRFVGFFLYESLRGGFDVARRTLRPKLDIRPGFVQYECTLPGGRPRLLFASCASLLPGTLTAEMHDRRLIVHLLDTESPVEGELRALEETIAGMFSLSQEPRHA